MFGEREDKENRGGEANAWTSYSDLFMAVAILFLILFVFSMFKTGIQQVKTAIEQRENLEYQLGRIPEAVRKKNEVDLKNVDQSVQTLAEKREILRKSLEELEQFSASIESQEKSMKELYTDQLQKTAMLDSASEQIIKQRREIEELQKAIQEKDSSSIELQTKLSEQIREAQSERQSLQEALESARASHLSQQADLSRSVENLTKSLNEREAQLTQAQELVERTSSVNSTQSRSIAERDTQVTTLQLNVSTLASEVAELRQELETKQAQIRHLQEQTAEKEGKLATADARITKMKARMRGLKANNETLKSDLEGAQQLIGQLKGKVDPLEQSVKSGQFELDALEKKLGQLMEENSGLKQGIATTTADGNKVTEGLKAELAKLKGENERLSAGANQQQSDNRILKQRLDDVVRDLNILSEERKSIANSVVKALESGGVSVDVDRDSGIITLRMDDAFYFRNDSFQLTDAAKAKMKKMIPLYAKSLLGDKKTADRIAAITITGFASPRFRGKFVDPAGDNPTAYAHNLELSTNRAREIAQYIFGPDIGNYRFKRELKYLTSSSGKSLVDPVFAELGKNVEQGCGPYDCAKSRRVEINFVLKDRKEIDQKFDRVTQKLSH